MPKNDQFGKALRAVRDAMGLSQPDFAAAVGLREGIIKDWEQSHTRPSFEKFTALLRKLGPDADYLLKALAIQGEMVEAPRANEELHIALEVIMQNAPRTVRERFASELEEAGNKWADREKSPVLPIRDIPRGTNTEKVKK